MKFLFDTDHISFLQRPLSPECAAISLKMSRHQPTEFAFSIVSFHEQTTGGHAYIARAKTTASAVRGYKLLGEILQGFLAAPVLPFDQGAAAVFDSLQAQRLRVATMDMRIAAIALARRLVLLTRNTIDFGRVPGLTIEDWTL